MAKATNGRAFLMELAEGANPEVARRLRAAAGNLRYSEKAGDALPGPVLPTVRAVEVDEPPPTGLGPGRHAPGRLIKPVDWRWAGVSNKLERDYSVHLSFREGRGEILWAGCNLIRLRIGGGAFYKPDFLVRLPDGAMEFHETKGFWREAARVRIKTAAMLYRGVFAFRAVQRKRGKWVYEDF